MFWRKGFIFFLILFFLLIILNFIARKKMEYSYAALAGYNQLYVIKEQLKISQVTENSDHTVTLAFSGRGVRKENTFKVYHENRLLTSAIAANLTFRPLAGAKKYVIRLNDIKDDITIDLNYTPDSVVKNIGDRFSGGCEFTNVSIPVQQGHLYGLDEWAWPFNRFENEEEQAARYIKDSMKIVPGDSAMTRVAKIARFILERTKGMDGTPTDSMILFSPINQLKCVQAGKSKIWCGLYTDMFCYFASRAGVPARYIQCGTRQSDISSGVHVFIEVYIEEYEQWVYVDLLAKTVFVKKGTKYLNAVDVQRLLKYSIDEPDLTAGYFNGDSIVQMPFNQVASIARYYFHPNTTFTFYFGDYLKIQHPRNLLERGKKAFYTKPYYALYGDNVQYGKWQLNFRMATTYALVILLCVCLFFGLLSFKRK
jgi:hypothetical protein